MSEAEDAVLSFPPEVPPARHIRSTLLLSSLAALRDSGLGERYEAALPPDAREVIFGTIAGVWLPVDIAVAHYRACDSLMLSPDEAYALGKRTEERTRGTLLGTAVRLAKGAGVTPWTMLPQLQRFWDRGFDGGGISVRRLGPKDARVDVVKLVCFDVPYFRHACRGLLASSLELFCARCWAHERTTGPRPPGTISYRIQWA